MYATRFMQRPVVGAALLLSVCLLLTAIVPARAFAQGQTRLEITFDGMFDGSCDTFSTYVTPAVMCYVDGMYDIVVTLLPDGKLPGQVEYQGVTDWTWPAGLVISVASAASDTIPFSPSAALQERLGLKYYVSNLQAIIDSVWHNSGRIPHPALRAAEYHFAFHVPPELANQYLCIHAEWQHPLYGMLKTGSPCIRVIEPCSEAARHAIWHTQVDAALNQKDLLLAYTRADSIVTLGLRDVLGLIMAMDAAQRLGRYDDAIRFLDLCFEVNHTLIPGESPRPAGPPSEEERQFYEKQRMRLLEMKGKQQQQQR